MTFKLLGSENPPNQTLGNISQGIGFDLHPVEPAISGGDVRVVTQNVLRTFSFIDQNPSGLGVAHQVTFGTAGDSTPEWDVNANGEITCLVADEYIFQLKIQIGREGTPAVSQIYSRLLINGTPFGNTIHTIIDNGNIEIPLIVQQAFTFIIGDVVTVEIIRDTDGNDSGGLRAGIPDVVGWADSPSASISMSHTLAVTV